MTWFIKPRVYLWARCSGLVGLSVRAMHRDVAVLSLGLPFILCILFGAKGLAGVGRGWDTTLTWRGAPGAIVRHVLVLSRSGVRASRYVSSEWVSIGVCGCGGGDFEDLESIGLRNL